MTTISTAERLVTFINLFKVRPEHQARLVELLRQVTKEHVCSAAGFVSCALHRSIDGTRVTMYSQWRSMEAYEAMRRTLGLLPALREVLEIAEFEPGAYEVVETFDAVDS